MTTTADGRCRQTTGRREGGAQHLTRAGMYVMDAPPAELDTSGGGGVTSLVALGRCAGRGSGAAIVGHCQISLNAGLAMPRVVCATAGFFFWRDMQYIRYAGKRNTKRPGNPVSRETTIPRSITGSATLPYCMEVEERGRLIGDLRRSRGLTQTDLALLLGVDPTTVARWERGGATVQRRHWVKLAKRLGVTVEALGLELRRR